MAVKQAFGNKGVCMANVAKEGTVRVKWQQG